MENFYHLNPQEYIKATFKADMSNEYRFYLQHLKPKGKILEIGFGSGRDMLYFKNNGYDVYGIDIEDEFVEHAKGLGLNCEKVNIMDFNSDDKFDGIWACSSLIHFTSDDLENVFKKIESLLKDDGVAYVSFKYGDYEGYIAEKYYTYLTKEKLKKYNLNIIDMHISKDTLNRGNDWISFIFKK